MPFSSDFKDIYLSGIKAECEAQGVTAERVDEQHFDETILARIYRQIENCDFIIAEMTGQNPNVFYEVGYAHALGKPCALVTQNTNDIPFDLKHHPHVIYDGSIHNLREQLSPKISWLVDEIESRRLKTISLETNRPTGLLTKDESFHFGEFDLTLTLTNQTRRRSPEVEAIYISTTNYWSLEVNKQLCVSKPIDGTNTVQHLISPTLKRLSPGAFFKESITFTRRFWSKYSGEKPQDTYTSKGNVNIDIVTSEGTIPFVIQLNIDFDEFPF